MKIIKRILIGVLVFVVLTFLAGLFFLKNLQKSAIPDYNKDVQASSDSTFTGYDKVEQRAKGLAEDVALLDGDDVVIDDDVVDLEGRLAVAPRGALEHFERGGHGPAHLGFREWVGGAPPEIEARIGRRTPRCEGRMIHLVKIIQHNRETPR